MGRSTSVALISLVIATSCGYSLAGKGNFLPDYIKVIAIPEFENLSEQISLEELLTRMVVDEFNTRGRYVIQVDETGADAVLTGAVLSFELAPAVLQGAEEITSTEQASTYAVIVRAKVEFKDLVQDNVIWESDAFQFRDEYEIGEDPDEFFSQEGMALQRIAEEFAKSLVSSILEAF